VRGPVLWWCAVSAGLFVPGCHDGSRRPTPVLVVVTGIAPVVEMAKVDVRSLTPERGQDIQIVVDTENPAGGGERVDNEANRAERLVETPGLFALVGHLGSRGSLAAAPVYNRAEVVQLVPTATTHLLRDVGPWTFTEGAVLGRFAAEYLRARRVALFYVPDEYGMGLRAAAMRKLRENGVRVVDNVPIVGGADLEVLLASSLKRTPPDLILSLCPAGQTGMIAQIAERLQPGLRILAGDAATSLSQLNQTAGKATDSIYVATFWIPPGSAEAGRKFTERYQAMTGKTPEAGDALVYDAIMLLATAAGNVGTRREMIRQYLEALGVSRPPYQGVTGPIAFGSHQMSSVIIARVRHGRLEPVNWQ
jgi:branched-chain amino acid transport system substrate-binding protein